MPSRLNLPSPARRYRLSCAALSAVLAFGALSAAPAAAQQVNLYTTREPGLVKPLLDIFTKDTGIAVNTVFLDKGLPERVAAEGERSPADVLMTVDVGALLDLTEKGLTQPVRSELLEKVVPANLRSPQGSWFTLSLRARVVYAAKDRVKLTAIHYEDLADPQWKGRLCIRSGQHPYNNALIAAFIAKHGEAKAEQWVAGLKANLARKAAGGDREVARDILGELCDIGVGNSYYVGLMRGGKGGPEQKAWGDAIHVLLPTFENGGTHVNISGASVAKHAPNKAEAIKLLEFLVSDEAQQIYAHGNYEYPVKAGVAPDAIIAALGPLQVDSLPLGDIAKNRAAASRLADKVGFDK